MNIKNFPLTENQIQDKIDEDEDFINYPRFDNSIKKLLLKHEKGVKPEIIAKAMNMTVEEVEETYQQAVEKLKKVMKIGKYG